MEFLSVLLSPEKLDLQSLHKFLSLQYRVAVNTRLKILSLENTVYKVLAARDLGVNTMLE